VSRAHALATRALTAAALCLGGCALSLSGQSKLLRALHESHADVADQQVMEMPYRAHTPDLEPLLGVSREDLHQAMGPGGCVPKGAGERCSWGFSTLPARGDERPLRLEVELDEKGICTAARWTLAGG